MTNTQEIFQREKEMCELFQHNEDKLKICITYKVSSEGITIWVGYDKEDYWDVRRAELILSSLIKIVNWIKLSKKKNRTFQNINHIIGSCIH